MRITAVPHHEQPTGQPMFEVVCAIARHRHENLFEKGFDVSGHETSEGRDRVHRPCERRARHPRGGSRNLHEKPHGRSLGAEDGLETSAALPPDRCHLDHAAVCINRDYETTPLSGKYT